jgi:hypothetical protein
MRTSVQGRNQRVMKARLVRSSIGLFLSAAMPLAAV